MKEAFGAQKERSATRMKGLGQEKKKRKRKRKLLARENIALELARGEEGWEDKDGGRGREGERENMTKYRRNSMTKIFLKT